MLACRFSLSALDCRLATLPSERRMRRSCLPSRLCEGARAGRLSTCTTNARTRLSDSTHLFMTSFSALECPYRQGVDALGQSPQRPALSAPTADVPSTISHTNTDWPTAVSVLRNTSTSESLAMLMMCPLSYARWSRPVCASLAPLMKGAAGEAGGCVRGTRAPCAEVCVS